MSLPNPGPLNRAFHLITPIASCLIVTKSNALPGPSELPVRKTFSDESSAIALAKSRPALAEQRSINDKRATSGMDREIMSAIATTRFSHFYVPTVDRFRDLLSSEVTEDKKTPPSRVVEQVKRLGGVSLPQILMNE